MSEDVTQFADPAKEVIKDVVQDPNKAFMIVGDRAYKSQEDVEKKLEHSDTHITTLETEAKTSVSKIEELTKLLDESDKARVLAEEKATNAADLTNKQDDRSGPTDTAPIKSEITPEKIAEIARDTVAQDKQQLDHEANHAESLAAAVELWGGVDQVNKKMIEIAADLGVSVKSLRDMASTSPKMFKKTVLDIKDTGTTSMTTGGSAHRASSGDNDTGDKPKYESTVGNYSLGSNANRESFDKMMADELAKHA